MKINEKYEKSFYIPLSIENVIGIIRAVDSEREEIKAGIILQITKKENLQ